MQSKNETKIWIKKDGFKAGIKLKVILKKLIEKFQGCYKLNCDQRAFVIADILRSSFSREW